MLRSMRSPTELKLCRSDRDSQHFHPLSLEALYRSMLDPSTFS